MIVCFKVDFSTPLNTLDPEDQRTLKTLRELADDTGRLRIKLKPKEKTIAELLSELHVHSWDPRPEWEDWEELTD